MATLDLTTVPRHDASNTRIRKFVTYTGPASYATGGDTLNPVDVGMSRIDLLNAELATNGTVVLLLRYDYTNKKVKWFDLAGNETAAATNVSTYSARVEVIGI